MLSVLFFFFFQAEDGIRDWSVTGVQTCALPISVGGLQWTPLLLLFMASRPASNIAIHGQFTPGTMSPQSALRPGRSSRLVDGGQRRPSLDQPQSAAPRRG